MFKYNYDANKVGARIRKVRKENKMTQEELATKLVLSVDSISNYENGKTTCMPEHMMHLCEIFNMSMDYFYLYDSKNFETGSIHSRIDDMIGELNQEDLVRVEQMLKLFLKK